MMKTKIVIVLLVALLLAGCDSIQIQPITPADKVTKFHDNELNVTCWIYSDYKMGGLSCIPDWQLTPPEEKETTSIATGVTTREETIYTCLDIGCTGETVKEGEIIHITGRENCTFYTVETSVGSGFIRKESMKILEGDESFFTKDGCPGMPSNKAPWQIDPRTHKIYQT